MMTNRQIAKTFQLLAKMMELHGENEFRIRTYRNAYDALKRLDKPVAEMSADEIAKIKGIGTSAAEKIGELLGKGSMERFGQYAAKTPEGIRELLMIKGLGAGKVKAIWKEMGIETPGELLYACNENRLVGLSGFGLKTQAEIKKQVEYHLESEGKYLWAAIEPGAERIMQSLRSVFSGRIALAGEFARKCPIVRKLEFLAEGNIRAKEIDRCKDIVVLNKTPPFECVAHEMYNFTLHLSTPAAFESTKFRLTGDKNFMETAGKMSVVPEIPPELMEGVETLERAMRGEYTDLIIEPDIVGIVHCHSTYSDGLHSLKEMAEFTRDAGYKYIGITEHSKSAVYARGLSSERVMEQWKEIDNLNVLLAPFRIFKGIESDILSDGSLDYEEDVLCAFDFVIASIHSSLKMDLGKSTVRLIKAIENPYTRILGHPTGRLLLARQGYPIDHQKIIDACSQNEVVIELNANPQRLDIDSSYIPYALEKGVLIAINPDAHSRESIHNVRFGIYAARRGGLPRSMCLNCKSLDDFTSWVHRKG